MSTILIVVLIIILFGGLHPNVSQNWGHGPSGIAGLLLIVLLILLLTGRL